METPLRHTVHVICTMSDKTDLKTKKVCVCDIGLVQICTNNVKVVFDTVRGTRCLGSVELVFEKHL